MKVKCIGEGSPLTCMKDKIYEVLSIEDGEYRIVDETEEDYLYSPSFFTIVDSEPPAPILA